MLLLILKSFKNQIFCHFIFSVKIKLIQLNFKKEIYRNFIDQKLNLSKSVTTKF